MCQHYYLNYYFSMKKSIIRISLQSTTIIIISSLFAVGSFADTTSTGTTSTGVNCSTASGVKAELAVIQQAFLVEMTRLINDKWTAYTRAMSLSGSQRSDAIKAANEKYRIWVQNAIKIRETTKQKNKSHYYEKKLICKGIKKTDQRERKIEKHNENKIEKKEMKPQIKELKKDLKKYNKKYRSNKRDQK